MFIKYSNNYGVKYELKFIVAKFKLCCSLLSKYIAKAIFIIVMEAVDALMMPSSILFESKWSYEVGLMPYLQDEFTI